MIISSAHKQYFAKIVDQLEVVRKMVCPYAGETCDCKHGINSQTNLIGSEQTGCPELRVLIGIYRAASQ
jgi:hypothetical protein